MIERADPRGAVVDKALRREAPEIAFSLACLRGTVALLRGDTASSQTDFRVVPIRSIRRSVCSAVSAAPNSRCSAANADRLPHRLADVRAAIATVGGRVSRWSLALEWATQAVRRGEAEAVRSEITAVLAPMQASGYRLLELDAHLSLAEAAIVLGDQPQAQHELDAARAQLGRDDWLGRRRFDIAAAGLALARNDNAAAAELAVSLHAECREHRRRRDRTHGA